MCLRWLIACVLRLQEAVVTVGLSDPQNTESSKLLIVPADRNGSISTPGNYGVVQSTYWLPFSSILCMHAV